MSYFRNKRHLNKYFFAQNTGLFYEEFEKKYNPSDEFYSIVKSALNNNWHIIRDGIWYHTFPTTYRFPVQGWKIHISARIDNSERVLAKVSSLLEKNEIAFKFALDSNVLMTINFKNWYRGASGKFITIYPQKMKQFCQIIQCLHEELEGEEGPYILSDKRYKNSKVVYYRYGGIANKQRLLITGEKEPVIYDPEGNPIEDKRTPFFNPPTWVFDPFIEVGEKEEKAEEAIVLNNRYVVRKPISFSNSGGVYLAKDRKSNQNVIIKEARPFTNMEKNGLDAVQLLKKEYQILKLLNNTKFVPSPIDLFQEWENWFLVEEYITGVDLRTMFLNNNPLLNVYPTKAMSSDFYNLFRTISENLIFIINSLHKKNIILGDMSPYNIIVDPITLDLKIIDLEAAMRIGIDKFHSLHTPGFRRAENLFKKIQTKKDDYYSLATILSYLIFPINVFEYLNNDLYQKVFPKIIKDLGWPQRSYSKIMQLTKGYETNNVNIIPKRKATIKTPDYNDSISKIAVKKIISEMGEFLIHHMRTENKDFLYHADPFMFRTNPLSFGFGALGVLYTLKKCNLDIPNSALDWLRQKIHNIHPGDYPPGFFTGLSGVSYALAEIGLFVEGEKILKMAMKHPLLANNHSLYYGMAGIGLINLYYYFIDKKKYYLDNALDISKKLLSKTNVTGGVFSCQTKGETSIGLGYGHSGIALFFLRLYQITGDEKYLNYGKKYLMSDLDYCKISEDSVISIPGSNKNSTLEPYIEEGSGGVLKVILRYHKYFKFDPLDEMVNDIYRKYSVFCGLQFGLASFVDVFIDLYRYFKEKKFLSMAKRPIAGIRDLYLLKYSTGYATPGDGLFRISCDYATGVAGVMRALFRYVHRDPADYFLDEVDR